MQKLKKLLASVVTALAIMGWHGPLAAAIDAILPTVGDATGAIAGTFTDPTGITRDVILLDGVPIAFKYDDFWSYSMPGLAALQAAGFIPLSFGDYSFAVGVGGQDAVLFTQAGGQDNDPVGVGDCCILEEPGPTTSGNTEFVENWWGQDDQDNDGTLDTNDGPNTVGEVLAFLQSYDPNQTIPAFIVDWNQTGGDDSLLVAFEVFLLDDANPTTVVENWSLDTNNNGTFDRDALALNFGQVCFGVEAECGNGDIYLGPTDSGNTYSLTHNVGSGAPDFAVFADTMDLSLYDPNDIFVIHLVLGCEGGTGPFPDPDLGCGTNGAEEGFMTGRVSAIIPPPPSVPEPSVLALLGLGFAGIGLGRRRMKSA